MSQYDVHVCMVSDQAAANLIPVLDNEFKPKEVVLLVSPEMKVQAESFQTVLKMHQIKPTIVEIDNAFDLDEITAKLEYLLLSRDEESIALNVTGGTKLMAIAAQQVFQELDKPIFYTLSDKNVVLILGKPSQRVELNSKLKLRHYLAAYGYEVKGDLISQNDSTHDELTTDLVRDMSRYQDGLPTLNKLAAEAGMSRGQVLRAKLQDDMRGNRAFLSLLERLEEGGILKRSYDSVTFTSEKARVYANGGWLEEYVFKQVNALPNIQDKAHSLEFVRGGNQTAVKNKGRNNEFDIAFISKNALHIIECKTRTQSNLEADILYKLQALADVGGIMTKKCLISYYNATDELRNRAKDNRIELIEGKDLQRLRQKLTNWIEGRR